jgi:hypothetical protein
MRKHHTRADGSARELCGFALDGERSTETLFVYTKELAGPSDVLDVFIPLRLPRDPDCVPGPIIDAIEQTLRREESKAAGAKR